MKDHGSQGNRRRIRWQYVVLTAMMAAIIGVMTWSIRTLVGTGYDSIVERPQWATRTPGVTRDPTPSPSPTPEPVKLVAYEGMIEHLFVHPLVVYPELAFDGDSQARGMDDYMTTVKEFRTMLEELYRNQYVLVTFDQCYGEKTLTDGTVRYGRRELMLPEGKKPLVISTDDINYYDYMRQNGCNEKLVVGPDGHIAEMSRDPQTGEMKVTQGNEVFSILNAFLEEHPDFSHQGAKCYVGVTGYAGVLGYRTQKNAPNRESEIAEAKKVIECLKNDGFQFASHSYAHGHMSDDTVEKVRSDCEKWRDEVESLVGPTEVYLFPYGEWPPQNSEPFVAIMDYGFKHFSGVGIGVYNRDYSGGYSFDDRKNIDGLTLRQCLKEGPSAVNEDGSPKVRTQVWKMMDVEKVFDREARGDTPGQGAGVG